MNADQWKKSVTGVGNCPAWCVSAHHENPDDEAIFHVSEPVTVPMPPQVSGELLSLTVVTVADEDYHTPDRGRSADRVEISLNDGQGQPTHDYIPVRAPGDLDELISGLRRAADALEPWRGRLPAAA
ncbi:DUF6907 domain-containing protein [Streptomyces sp. NPDC057638]|uniref:DUF6907 domain-containing protein n=1 Tax=Streptomyces sp. NPDC057638 TaxID=3346190 RepID=UPI0036A00838